MPSDLDDLAAKRSLLMAARLRFSASGAAVREQAIQRILEQNLATCSVADGLTEAELAKVLDLGSSGTVLKTVDVQYGLRLLKAAKRVVQRNVGTQIRYCLTDNVAQETTAVLRESENLYDEVIRVLFSSSPPADYKSAFLHLLSSLFSRIGDAYVRILSGTKDDNSLFQQKWLVTLAEEIASSHSIPNANVFLYGIVRFFRDSTPRYDQIKWNMAQNYYVAKALGLDLTANLFPTSNLKGQRLYLDTNVLIAALVPEHRHHGSFQELSQACREFGIELAVSNPTLEELRGVVTAHAKLLREVLDKIPEQTKPKVRSFLLEPFLTAKANDSKLSLETFLKKFEAPILNLKKEFGIEIIDDRWFDAARNAKDVIELAQSLSRSFELLRNRPKNKGAALHDAVIMTWLRKEKESAWKGQLVTLDLTLADAALGEQVDDKPLVICLEALLQWCMLRRGDTADKVAGLFSEALRYQFLPRELFFELRDFKVFADMEIETSQLPFEDVEACIMEVRKMVPALDINRAEHREKAAREVQRYFADPGSKYNRTMQEMQQKMASLQNKLNDEQRIREEIEGNLRKAKDLLKEKEEETVRLGQRIEEESAARRGSDVRISILEKAQVDHDKADRRRALIHSACWRLVITFVLCAGAGAVLGWAIWDKLAGQNDVQKFIGSWKLWASIGAGFLVTARFVLGKERIKALFRRKD